MFYTKFRRNKKHKKAFFQKTQLLFFKKHDFFEFCYFSFYFSINKIVRNYKDA
jgi:hypothetical protein